MNDNKPIYGTKMLKVAGYAAPILCVDGFYRWAMTCVDEAFNYAGESWCPEFVSNKDLETLENTKEDSNDII